MSKEYYILFRSPKRLKMYEYPYKEDLIRGLDEDFKHTRFSDSLRSFSKQKENIAMIIKGEVIIPKAKEFTITKWEID